MKAKKIAFWGLSITLALILSFIESHIPAFVAVPGVKVGLPNIVIVFLLYKLGWKDACIISLARVFLVSLLFGSAVSMVYGLCGAVLSMAGMILVRRIGNFSCISVSVIGGVLHNVGQIAAACFMTSTAEIVFYLPVLLFSGTIAGVIIGVIAGIIVKKSEKFML